jgi:hypothetical protein
VPAQIGAVWSSRRGHAVIWRLLMRGGPTPRAALELALTISAPLRTVACLNADRYRCWWRQVRPLPPQLELVQNHALFPRSVDRAQLPQALIVTCSGRATAMARGVGRVTVDRPSARAGAGRGGSGSKPCMPDWHRLKRRRLLSEALTMAAIGRDECPARRWSLRHRSCRFARWPAHFCGRLLRCRYRGRYLVLIGRQVSMVL